VFRDGTPRLGDSVVVYGFPLVNVLASQGNLTTGSISALAGLGNDSRMLQISAPVQPGNSGGPLLDSYGTVVGVVVMKLNARMVQETTGDLPQNVNFAIKGSVAREFLAAQGVVPLTGLPVTTMSNADVGDVGRSLSLLVECTK
jgi:S1-C subfamily serine protease